MTIQLEHPVPILRLFDEKKAKEFYIGFLEFQIDWEHRFEENMPLYLQISKNNCVIHLSEHHGDCSPGGTLRIRTAGLKSYRDSLIGKDYPYARPGLEKKPWGTREMILTDPFGNRLIFFEEIER